MVLLVKNTIRKPLFFLWSIFLRLNGGPFFHSKSQKLYLCDRKKSSLAKKWYARHAGDRMGGCWYVGCLGLEGWLGSVGSGGPGGPPRGMDNQDGGIERKTRNFSSWQDSHTFYVVAIHRIPALLARSIHRQGLLQKRYSGQTWNPNWKESAE